jgi:hypothetical protein
MKWFHVSGVDAGGLLLQREQLPLPERVHRRVGVLVQLRQGGDVDGHAQRSAAQRRAAGSPSSSVYG